MNLDKYIEHILFNFDVKTAQFCGDLYVYPVETQKPILQINFDCDSFLVTLFSPSLHRLCVDDSDLFEVIGHYLADYRQ